MLNISLPVFLWSGLGLVYIVAVGTLLLTRYAKKPDMQVARPFVTMLQVASLSGLVFLLASVPSYVARIVNPEILPFIMPYSAALFAVCFIIFIQKLQSARSGWHQAGVSLWLAASISAMFIMAQLLLRAALNA